MMTTPRLDALQAIAAEFAAAPVLFTCGATSREMAALDRRPNHLYVVDSMGLVSSILLGLSLGLEPGPEPAAPPRKVVGVEQDDCLAAADDSRRIPGGYHPLDDGRAGFLIRGNAVRTNIRDCVNRQAVLPCQFVKRPARPQGCDKSRVATAETKGSGNAALVGEAGAEGWLAVDTELGDNAALVGAGADDDEDGFE